MSSRRRHRKRRSRLRKFLGKALKWLILPIVLCLIAIIYSNHIINKAADGKTYSDLKEIPHRKVALLLGTTPKAKSGRPNSFYAGRIQAAVDLYNAGKFDKLILSGAGNKEGYNEPLSMRSDLIEQGIPDSILILDEKGDRTVLSIEHVKKTFGVDSCTIISQLFHNNRAIYMAEHVGLNAIGYNAPDSPFLYWRVKNHLREYLARVKAVIDAKRD